jgi:hypothetical protein
MFAAGRWFVWRTWVVAVVVTLAVSSQVSPGVQSAEPAAAGDVLKGLRPGHPRLYVLDAGIAEVKGRLASDPLLKRWSLRLQRDAERMLSEPPVERKLIGPRLLDKSRTALRRVSTLAGLYRLDGDRRKAERARAEMLAVAAFSDWNPSHFLDVAEMTNALAIGYDWLYGFLSPDDRAIIHRAIVEKGLEPGLKVYASGKGWPTYVHNWNQVCNGGLAAGALAVADEEPETSRRFVDHARASIALAMRSFAPDGGWAEGPGYWDYATRYNVYFLNALQTALGTDFGLGQLAGFPETGTFRIQSVGPIGRTFNYADASDGAGTAAQMLWLAKTFGRPDYARHEIETAGDRVEIFHLLWAAGQALPPPASPRPVDSIYRGIDVAFFRSRWDDPQGVFVGFKGGDNKANHSHLDLGTFVLDALSQRWAADLGGDDYNLPGYFGKQRWTYYRLRTEAHNTLTVDGENQNPKARAPLVAFFSSPGRAFAVADLSIAYAPRVRRAFRGLALLDRRRVLVQDEIEAADIPVELVWNFHTRARVETLGARALLSIGSSRLEARILSPERARFEVVSANPAPPQAQQRDVTNLVVRLPHTSKVRLAVELSPAGSRATPGIEPLDRWIALGRLDPLPDDSPHDPRTDGR